MAIMMACLLCFCPKNPKKLKRSPSTVLDTVLDMSAFYFRCCSVCCMFIVVLAGLCSLTSWVRMDLRRRLVASAASAQGRCEGEAVGAWTIYPVEFSGLPLASCLWHHPSSTKVFAAHCDLVVVVDDWWWQSNERRWSDGQMVVSYHFRYPACSKKGHLRRCDFVIAESGL